MFHIDPTTHKNTSARHTKYPRIRTDTRCGYTPLLLITGTYVFWRSGFPGPPAPAAIGTLTSTRPRISLGLLRQSISFHAVHSISSREATLVTRKIDVDFCNTPHIALVHRSCNTLLTHTHKYSYRVVFLPTHDCNCMPSGTGFDSPCKK